EQARGAEPARGGAIEADALFAERGALWAQLGLRHLTENRGGAARALAARTAHHAVRLVRLFLRDRLDYRARRTLDRRSSCGRLAAGSCCGSGLFCTRLGGALLGHALV